MQSEDNAERADVPWLSRRGEAIELGDGETIVGGGSQSSWTVPDAGLAPRHFVVVVRREAASVRPFGPDAIVTLNGRQISGEQRHLRDGDVVAAGRATFVYSATRPGAGAAEPRTSPSDTEGQAYLVNTATGAVHALDEPSTGIGRDRSNAIVVSDATASRFHAEVRREAGGWVLHPMGSSGTKVNGRRTGSPCLLEAGDEIEVAYTALRFGRGPVPPDSGSGPGVPPTQEELDAARRPTMELADDEMAEVQAGAATSEAPAEGGARRGTRWWVWALVALLLAALVVWSTAA